jgi:hypothetical protein
MNALTHGAPANGGSDDSDYQPLLGNALSFANQFDLRPGIALTAGRADKIVGIIRHMRTSAVSKLVG